MQDPKSIIHNIKFNFDMLGDTLNDMRNRIVTLEGQVYSEEINKRQLYTDIKDLFDKQIHKL